MNVLVVDIGGTHVKVLASGEAESRQFDSGPALLPKPMALRTQKITEGWSYDVVSIGYPGPVLRNRPIAEPHNLGCGWVGFDFERAFGCVGERADENRVRRSQLSAQHYRDFVGDGASLQKGASSDEEGPGRSGQRDRVHRGVKNGQWDRRYADDARSARRLFDGRSRRRREANTFSRARNRPRANRTSRMCERAGQPR
jgi:hypothetical protein